MGMRVEWYEKFPISARTIHGNENDMGRMAWDLAADLSPAAVEIQGDEVFAIRVDDGFTAAILGVD